MTTELLTPPQPVAEPGRDPLRPATPDGSIARLPRRLIGVQESILDTVPEERPRYTRLGVILINTALMAALSLFVAMQRVIDVHWLAAVPIALFWGMLVLVIDSWMVASTHGNIVIPGTDVTLGVNAYRKPKKAA